MPTDEQIWKMLDAWYQLIGRRVAPTAAERDRDFAAMQRSLQSFEASVGARCTCPCSCDETPHDGQPCAIHGAAF